MDKVRAAAFELIRERTRNGAPLQEVEVKDFVRKGFADAGLLTDHGPIVGCNANACNPHYEPTASVTAPIKSGDWVLLDMWAKLDQPGAVYYDITWTGVLRRHTRPTRCASVFTTVRDARDAAISKVQAAIAAGRGPARLRGGRRLPRGDRQGRLRASTSRTAPATRSASKSTATAPTWTTSRRTTSGA